MKNTIFAIIISLLLVNSAAIMAETLLATATMELNGQTINIEKFLGDKGVVLRLSSADGTKLGEFAEMGSEDKLFTADGMLTGLAIKDLTGDGVPEIITAAFYGPTASGLYILNYDSDTKTLVPIKFLNDIDPDLSTEFMVSDISQENNGEMVINEDGSLTSLGKIYPEDIAGEIIPGFYTYKFVDGTFKLIEKKAVPAGE